MTSKTRLLQIRVTKDQLQRIKEKAKAKGYRTTSDFIRNLALREDLMMEYKINAIFEKVVR